MIHFIFLHPMCACHITTPKEERNFGMTAVGLEDDPDHDVHRAEGVQG